MPQKCVGNISMVSRVVNKESHRCHRNVIVINVIRKDVTSSCHNA